MSISLRGLQTKKAAYTEPFAFLRGAYTIGTESLPYFSIGMRVDEAIRSLKLARDVVLDPMAPIKMEELFQRELNEARATGEIAQYLRQPKEAKFFNSLTVVILPMDPKNERRLAHSYEDLPDRPPKDSKLIVDIGPVRIQTLSEENENVGYISWDTRFAKAVIVDGQHRFYALDSLMRDAGFPYRADLASTVLPVLLLVPDRRAGFQTANDEQLSVLRTCRALFIDLNKHARRVSPWRQYLLDDRDLNAVAMRHLMSDDVGGSQEEPTTRARTTGKLPMAIVDWWSENPQFESGLPVTTTVTLYELVQTALSVVPPSVATDYAAWRDYVLKIVGRLQLDGDDRFREAEVRRDIELAEARGLPFGLSTDQVSAAADGFQKSLGAMIVRPLTELTPYVELITRYYEAELISGRFEQWLGLDEAGRIAFATEVGEDPTAIARGISDEVKPKYKIAYQVVFQKAFIGALVEMDRYRQQVMEHWKMSGDDSRDVFVDTWMAHFNRIFAHHLGSNDDWASAGVTANGKISWTQPSQRAIVGFIVYSLIAPLEQWSHESGEKGLRLARDWLTNAWGKSGPGKPAQTIEGLYKVGAAWKRSVERYVRDQFAAREEERVPDDNDFLDFGARQLARLAAGLARSG